MRRLCCDGLATRWTPGCSAFSTGLSSLDHLSLHTAVRRVQSPIGCPRLARVEPAGRAPPRSTRALAAGPAPSRMATHGASNLHCNKPTTCTTHRSDWIGLDWTTNRRSTSSHHPFKARARAPETTVQGRHIASASGRPQAPTTTLPGSLPCACGCGRAGLGSPSVIMAWCSDDLSKKAMQSSRLSPPKMHSRRIPVPVKTQTRTRRDLSSDPVGGNKQPKACKAAGKHRLGWKSRRVFPLPQRHGLACRRPPRKTRAQALINTVGHQLYHVKVKTLITL